MLPAHKLSRMFLRISLSYVFIAFGADKFVHPFLWLGWIPPWMESFLGMSRETWLQIIGVTEIVIGIAALFPLRIIRQLGAMAMILHLIGVFTQTGLLNDIGIRDTGLLLVAIALCLTEFDRPLT